MTFPYVTFGGACKRTKTNFSFSFELGRSPQEFNQENKNSLAYKNSCLSLLLTARDSSPGEMSAP